MIFHYPFFFRGLLFSPNVVELAEFWQKLADYWQNSSTPDKLYHLIGQRLAKLAVC
jgi:hypothetical protein